MKHQTLFPEVEVPLHVMLWLEAYGWRDTSYGNDCGPSWTAPDGRFVLMVCDADALLRESPSLSRYMLMRAEDGAVLDEAPLGATEDWQTMFLRLMLTLAR